MSVGGNIQALLQVKKNGAKNAIGERVNTWVVSKQKVGESATLEGQMTELTEDILVSALHLVKSTSEDTTYVKYVSKENITEADYLENVAYVGTLSSGKNVIIILPNALCTEAFELETKNAEQTTFAVKFECTADLENDSLNKLDIAIYYPTSVV